MSDDLQENSDPDVLDEDGPLRLAPALACYKDQPCLVRDYHDLHSAVLEGSSTHGSNLHTLLRTLVDITLTRSVCLKGLQRRELIFRNLSLQPLAGARAPPQDVVVVESIVPKSAHVRYYGLLRHKSVEICPQFLISLYLFSRFHIRNIFGESDLTDSHVADENFLHYKLMNGGQKMRSLSYSQQYKAATKLLKLCGNTQIGNLGKLVSTHYNNDPELGAVQDINPMLQPSAVSVRTLNLDVLSQYAGFADHASYRVRRAALDPPPAVVSQIFPFLNAMQPTDGFFRLLDRLRRTLVQDVAEMKLRHPDSFIFGHPIFFSDDFNRYVELYRKLVAEEPPGPGPSHTPAPADQNACPPHLRGEASAPVIPALPRPTFPSTPSSDDSVSINPILLPLEREKPFAAVKPGPDDRGVATVDGSVPPLTPDAGSRPAALESRLEKLESAVDGLHQKQNSLHSALEALNTRCDGLLTQQSQAMSNIASSLSCFGILAAVKNANSLHHIQHLANKTAKQVGSVQNNTFPAQGLQTIADYRFPSPERREQARKRGPNPFYPMLGEAKRQRQA